MAKTTKKTTNNTMVTNTNDTLKIIKALNNISDDDVFNLIMSRTSLNESEKRIGFLLEGGNPEYCATINFEGCKETLRDRCGGTTINVKVYKGSELLLNAEYTDIKSAYYNHSEMYLGDTIRSDGREGFCYGFDEYFIVVVGKKCTDKYAIDKKK